MVQQITNGIKISVKTKHEGIRIHGFRKYYIFSYSVTIENQSKDAVQLLSRHWHIFDSLKKEEIVEGEGVIGEKPILSPKKTYTYTSSCHLISPIGSMHGFFNMINFTTTKRFRVLIPQFQLTLPQILN
ncbi:MAG: Co2+/Mg2+ efflux protein ApaG [Flavobacteriales bacterium]|jgi:ApaG protein|nr:Co2+/Mg2+ efflux protein ApaG [Flavobacteriales bacterium]